MSKGILFVGFDTITDQNQTIKYTKLAKISSNLIKKHLNVPCALISDCFVEGFDENIIVEKPSSTTRHVAIGKKHQSYNWYNDYRRRAFDLTPFDETILLDVDYFAQTNQLENLFGVQEPFMIAKDVYDPMGLDSFANYRLLPNRTIPQCWATIIKFNKCSKVFFEYADMIANDYHYYSEIFKFTSGQYRNDMVFSIVAHMLPAKFIPWPMWMTSSESEIVNANNKGLKVLNNNRVMRIKNDLHVLDKTIAVDEKKLDMLEKWSLSCD